MEGRDRAALVGGVLGAGATIVVISLTAPLSLTTLAVGSGVTLLSSAASGDAAAYIYDKAKEETANVLKIMVDESKNYLRSILGNFCIFLLFLGVALYFCQSYIKANCLKACENYMSVATNSCALFCDNSILNGVAYSLGGGLLSGVARCLV